MSILLQCETVFSSIMLVQCTYIQTIPEGYAQLLVLVVQL